MIRVAVAALLVCLTFPLPARAESPAPAAPSAPAAPPAPAESPAQAAPPAAAKTGVKRIYYGGSIGLIFGDYTSVSVEPMVGYNFTPKFSAGGRVSYEYVRDHRYTETHSSHNYGFGTFGRYRFIPELYGHAEFAAMNYDLYTASGASTRDWVPFLYLGGGYTQRIAKNVSAYAEILVDVWQDDNSPYQDWAPQYCFGIGVGF